MVAAVGPITGGAGGSPLGDGTEGSGANSSFLKNTPVEINEIEVPIKIRRYGLAADSGGAGKFRGGTAIEMWFEALAPNTRVTARNMDRTRFTSWGVQNGRAGAPSYFLLNPNTNEERNLGNLDFIKIGPGDVIHVASGGAGGWGNPQERAIEAVCQDVKRGFVSEKSALDDYGVVIFKGNCDLEATSKQRSKLMTDVSDNNFFDYGAGRVEYEKIWNRENYDTLTKILAKIPIHWRFFIKHRIFEMVGDQETFDNGQKISTYFESLLTEFPQLQETLKQKMD